MSGVIFWDEDTQIDFLMPDGRLYVPGADRLLANLERLTRCARQHHLPIVAIMCDHTMDDAEISASPDFRATFPPHCLRGTPGQGRVPATRPLHPLELEARHWTVAEVAALMRPHRGELVIKKQTLDPFESSAAASVLDVLDPTDVVVYGVTTDCCVHRAVLGLRDRGRRVYVVEDAIMPIDAAAGVRCIAAWRQRGAALVSTDDVVAGRAVPLVPPALMSPPRQRT